MQKLLTGIAAAAALALSASIGQACDWHQQHVTASSEQPQDSVAMSTYDGTPPAIEEEQPADAAAAPECAEGDENCAPASE